MFRLLSPVDRGLQQLVDGVFDVVTFSDKSDIVKVHELEEFARQELDGPTQHLVLVICHHLVDAIRGESKRLEAIYREVQQRIKDTKQRENNDEQ